MKATRILSLLLAVLMLASSLAACSTGTDDPADTNLKGTTAVNEEDTGPRDNLPANLNYKGDTITFITIDMSSDEISVEELNSDPINDSVYERNKFVESRLNVKFDTIISNSAGDYSAVEKVVTAVKSGSMEYDIVASPCYVVLDQSLSGTFANLTSSGYLEFDQPWWTQGFNEAVSYQGNQYAAVGSMLLSIYRFAFATVFNKNTFTNTNQTYLYEYVENGTWTLDKQISLIPVFHMDNGNGIQDATGDYYGLVSELNIYVDPFWASCEIDILAKDADGDFELVLDTNRLFDTAEKVIQLYYGTDKATFIGHAATTFSNGNSAMATIRILDLEDSIMRNMDDAYGIVPMPRLTTDQDGYYSTLHDAFTVVAVPTTVRGDRLDEVSAVLEAMGSASYRIVRPAYYETTLRTKLVSDPQSSEMMDMIIENIRTDAGYVYVYCLNGIHHVFRSVVDSGVNTIISDYKARQKGDQKTVKSLNTKLTRLADKNQ